MRSAASCLQMLSIICPCHCSNYLNPRLCISYLPRLSHGMNEHINSQSHLSCKRFSVAPTLYMSLQSRVHQSQCERTFRYGHIGSHRPRRTSLSSDCHTTPFHTDWKKYIYPLSERLVSLGIILAPLRFPFNPLNTIVLWWIEGFQGTLNWASMMARDAIFFSLTFHSSAMIHWHEKADVLNTWWWPVGFFKLVLQDFFFWASFFSVSGLNLLYW